ncbi:hypothetical protein Fcan01_15372 [Folsomia candida]|uniref:Uncharacterized protein n=1 Tax=Folsomia candida TaxID=158441 RepID=A0A226DYQ5_FOLCA|nr:hypothetical protein Fcan01_15372 [Folsomia candida]
MGAKHTCGRNRQPTATRRRRIPSQTGYEIDLQLRLYSEVKIIESMYNGHFQNFHLQFFYTAGCLAVILGSYITISFGNEISEQIAFLVYPLIALDALGMILFICYSSGKSNHDSKILIKNWLRNDPACRRNNCFKRIQACSPIKIRFGPNIMEIATVLMTTHFCFSSTVNLLLVGKG